MVRTEAERAEEENEDRMLMVPEVLVPYSVPSQDRQVLELFGPRRMTAYNEDERRFANLLQARVVRLLSGNTNRIGLLRKYANDLQKIGIIATTSDINRAALRPAVVEQITRSVILLLHDGFPGGARTQREERGNRIVETQMFTTKFPHIVLLRTDIFDASKGWLLESVWSAERLQNQRDQIKSNRAVDIALLGLQVVTAVL